MPAYPAVVGLPSGSCSSGPRFASGFLQIPPRDGHPCPRLSGSALPPPVRDSHSRSRACLAHKKSPTGRDPWGPAEAFPAARGGMLKYSSKTRLESRPGKPALRPGICPFSRMSLAFMTARGSLRPGELPARRMADGNGRLNSSKGHATPPQQASTQRWAWLTIRPQSISRPPSSVSRR
jgi:hypothetical protein